MKKKKLGKVKKKCKICDKEFNSRHDRPGIYCSRSCKGKDEPKISYKNEISCKVCSNSFFAKRYRKNAKFCSIKCMSISRGLSMRRENHPKWNGGKTKRPFFSRKKIEERKKQIGKCEICSNKENLEGHHIYGFKNDVHSIEILCAECHAKKHPNLSNFIRKKYG